MAFLNNSGDIILDANEADNILKDTEVQGDIDLIIDKSQKYNSNIKKISNNVMDRIIFKP